MNLLKRVIILSILLMLGWLPAKIIAAPPDEVPGQDYVVQADDWLSKLADKFYGDPLAYRVIFEATNAKAGQDDSYQPIADPDLIEIGQKLFVPDAQALSEQTLAAAEGDENPAPDNEPAVSAPPSAEQLALLASLDVKGAPPELYNDIWLNSEPLKLADLRGKVVIVEFWTYG